MTDFTQSVSTIRRLLLRTRNANKQHNKDKFIPLRLENANLVGNVHRLRITRKTHERLLEAESSNHSVDLLGLHSVELVDRVADLSLVGTEVHVESEDVFSLQTSSRDFISNTSIFFIADSVTTGFLMTA